MFHVLRELTTKSSSAFIAIIGGSGAGKSWLADRLQLLLGDIAGRISLDSFYRDRSHLPPSRREKINYDDPSAIDWITFKKVLTAYKAGKAVSVPRYDFITHSRLSDHVAGPPRPVTIINGPWLLHRRDLRNVYDLRIFVSCSRRWRQCRRVERDVLERGLNPASVGRQFRERVALMHDRYVEPQRKWADLILNMPLKQQSILDLAESVWVLLNTGNPLPEWMRATFRAELLNLLKFERR